MSDIRPPWEPPAENAEPPAPDAAPDGASAPANPDALQSLEPAVPHRERVGFSAGATVIGFLVGTALMASPFLLSQFDWIPPVWTGVEALFTIACIALIPIGRARTSTFMRGFGLGGLIPVVIVALGALLLWGTCVMGGLTS